MENEIFMREALKLAKQALEYGEVPVGAVIVLEDKIIGKGFNQPIRKNDPTAHAEIQAIKEAAIFLKNYRLTGAKIFSTLEPCLMCSGALVHARIDEIIFSAHDPKSGVIVSNAGHLLESDFINHKISFQGGLLAKESSLLLKNFFSDKRN
tara:strand:- start:150 stop:602 length:453 start_codon:yes stop_codon:yes gene_type:complete